MFKCYLTGIELKESNAYVVDIAKAKKTLQVLKNKYDGIEKLLTELGRYEKIEIFDIQKNKKVKIRRRRIICKQLAEAYAATYSTEKIFIPWCGWLKRISKNNKKAEKYFSNKKNIES